MICKNCGANIPDISKYCMACGTMVNNEINIQMAKDATFGYVSDYPDIRSRKTNNEEANDTQENTTLRSYYLDPDFSQDHDKSKKTAGLLGVFLGAFGVHRFYLGYTGLGIAQIAVSLVTCTLGGAIWGFIEGLCILCDVGITTDSRGNKLI